MWLWRKNVSGLAGCLKREGVDVLGHESHDKVMSCWSDQSSREERGEVIAILHNTPMSVLRKKPTHGVISIVVIVIRARIPGILEPGQRDRMGVSAINVSVTTSD